MNYTLLPDIEKANKRKSKYEKIVVEEEDVGLIEDVKFRKVIKSYLYIGASVLALSVILLLFSPIQIITPETKQAIHSRSTDINGKLFTGRHGASAVETKECSDAGVEILKLGGNAVDSAIASAFCIGVMSASATGIGGGGFMLIRSPNGTYEFIDYRETAPKGSFETMYVKDPLLAQRGGLAIGVPGEIRGLQLAHERHGVLPWKKLFESAIKLSRDGFIVNEYFHRKLLAAESWILEKPEWAAVYAPNGKLVEIGGVVKRPSYADTLETIANEGAEAFYTGKIANSIIKTIQENNGIMTLEDLENYRPLIRPTVNTYYHGRKITTTSAPTSGPILISILNILEKFNLKVTGRTGLNIHRIVETMKFAFAFRTEFGDPDFTHSQERYHEITTKEWADKVRRNITDNTTHSPLYYHPQYDHMESPGTMHLSVVDKDDRAVALTSTVNLLFGSRVMDVETGIILNDEMDDFSIPGVPNDFGLYPSSYNYIAPGKRPLSSITPTIIENDGKFEMAIGGSGGSQIITATLNAILNTFDFDMNLYDAIETPRVHHQLMPNRVGLQPGFGKDLENALRERHHEIYTLFKNGTVSAVQGVRKLPNGEYQGASDPRKFGLASAY